MWNVRAVRNGGAINVEKSLELLSLVTLRNRLDTGGPLSLKEASVIIDRVAELLDNLHLSGKIYGALNPGNILLLPEGQVQLLASPGAKSNATVMGVFGKTFAGDSIYLSSEEARGEPATAATDMWCLGALLHEMLTGYPPFVALRLCKLREIVLGSEPELLPHTASAAQIVLDRCLAKWPANRFISAQDMANALWASVPVSTTSVPVLVTTASLGAAPRSSVSLQQAVNRPFSMGTVTLHPDNRFSGAKRWMRFFGGRRPSAGGAAA